MVCEMTQHAVEYQKLNAALLSTDACVKDTLDYLNGTCTL